MYVGKRRIKNNIVTNSSIMVSWFSALFIFLCLVSIPCSIWSPAIAVIVHLNIFLLFLTVRTMTKFMYINIVKGMIPFIAKVIQE